MTHRQHMGRIIEQKPRYESRPYRMHPGRRAHIFGAIQPMDEPDTWHWSAKLVVAAFAVPALMLLIGGTR